MEHKDREYIYSLRKYILMVTGVFILSLIIGLLISVKNPVISENYLNSFKESFGWIKTLNPLFTMLIIFLNNAIKSFVALILGIGLGIVPLLFVAGNGIIIGILAGFVSRQQGTIFVIASTLPHGIIEVPMILISAGIGLRFGYVMYLSLKGMQTDFDGIFLLVTTIKHEFKRGVGFYLRRITPLLFVAAVIETFITPLIAFWTIV